MAVSNDAPPLPKEFADLQGVIGWALPSFDSRFERRLKSTQEELETTYAVLFPRAEAMIEYCERFPLESMPPEGRTLLNLLYSLAAISFAVEVWKRPEIPDSGATHVDCVLEPNI